MQFFDRILKTMFWAALIFAYAAAVMPAKEAPSIWVWDKANHMTAFFALTMLFALGWRRVKLLWVAVLLAAFGAAIEFSQEIPFIHRDASFDDWFADCAAILVGLCLAALLRPWLNRTVQAGR